MDLNNPAKVCLLIIVGITAVLALWVIIKFLRIWVIAAITGSGITLIDLIGMRLRKVNPEPIVLGRILLQKCGCGEISCYDLEAHVHSGGNAMNVANALVTAKRAGVDVDWKLLCEIDRQGRDTVAYVKRLAR